MTIPAWKFIAADMRLGYADKRPVKAGDMLTGPLSRNGKPAKPVLCVSGFHASVRARDALGYANGRHHIARVECLGEVVHGTDKLTCSEMRILWIADADKTLRLFAVRCRRKQAELRLAGREPSLAAVWALDVAERYINGEADRDELDAARSAVAADDAAAYAAVAADADAAYAAYAAAYAAAAADAAVADLESSLLALGGAA